MTQLLKTQDPKFGLRGFLSGTLHNQAPTSEMQVLLLAASIFQVTGCVNGVSCVGGCYLIRSLLPQILLSIVVLASQGSRSTARLRCCKLWPRCWSNGASMDGGRRQPELLALSCVCNCCFRAQGLFLVRFAEFCSWGFRKAQPGVLQDHWCGMVTT